MILQKTPSNPEGKNKLSIYLICIKSIFCFLDTKVAVGLMLLSHLIPPKKLKKYGNKCYKTSIANAKSSMIKRVNVSIKVLKF